MESKRTLKDLEELADRLEVRVRYERLSNKEMEVESGLFSFKGERTLLIDRSLNVEKRVEVFLKELKKIDLSSVYVRPYLRELLENP
jgi:hypothetical protein